MTVDRGFRDVCKFLEDQGFIVKMPKLLVDGQDQFTADEANESRMVTLTRWRIEAVNGRLKSMFRFLDHVIPCSYFNHDCEVRLARLVRISCALINAFCPLKFKDPQNSNQILVDLERRSAHPNTLKNHVISKNWHTKRNLVWTKVNGRNLSSFPRLTISQLEEITLGKFQIRNAVSYVDEHLRLGIDYDIFSTSLQKNPHIIMVRLRSKYRPSGTHKLWIEYEARGDGEIRRYYCQCRSGERTLGTCSHIASVLWFLGYKRHEDPTYEPRTFGTGLLDVARLHNRTQPYGYYEVERRGELVMCFRRVPLI